MYDTQRIVLEFVVCLIKTIMWRVASRPTGVTGRWIIEKDMLVAAVRT